MPTNYKKKSKINLLILGGTGMLGQALAKEAKSRCLTYKTVSRKNADINLDLTDKLSLIDLIRTTQPQIIINTIAKTDLDYCEKFPGEAYKQNSSIIGNLSFLCMNSDTKICHISTDHYFTGDNNKLHTENSQVQLLNEYAKTKFAAEVFASLNPTNLIVRTNIVGFRGWPKNPTFVEWLINELLLNKKIIMFDDYYTSSIDVKTFSIFLFDLIARDASGLINLASRECISKKDFIIKIASRLNLDLSNCTIGKVSSCLGLKRAESLGLDVSYAENLLGYKLSTADDVVNALCSEYKEFK